MCKKYVNEMHNIALIQEKLIMIFIIANDLETGAWSSTSARTYQLISTRWRTVSTQTLQTSRTNSSNSS